jgi:hypothetical protein
MPTKTAVPASEKQVELITRLLGEKVIPEACAPNVARLQERLKVGQVSGGRDGEASQVITWLFTLPRQQAPGSADPVTEVGLYERGGRVYKVQRSKTSGNLYAKVLDITEVPQECEGHESTGSEESDGEDMGQTVYCDGTCRPAKKKAKYEYAPGAFRVLDASAKIGLERANELSLQVGACMVCGRTLTAKESVARGIGPICAGRV